MPFEIFLLIAFALLVWIFCSTIRDGIRETRQLHTDWESWPTLAEYFQMYPETKTPYGPACRNCNSRNIHEYRWHPDTPAQMRIHRCRSCNQGVYCSVKTRIT